MVWFGLVWFGVVWCGLVVVLDATLTHVSVHARTILKDGLDLPLIYAPTRTLTPGSSTADVSATPRALDDSQL